MSLTPKQQNVLQALLAGQSITAAAAACRVGVSSIHRWLNEPAFACALKQAQDKIFRGSFDKLKAMVGEAIDRLRLELGNERDGTSSTRIKAADSIIGACLKLGDHLELTDRVAKLEADIEQAKHKRGIPS